MMLRACLLMLLFACTAVVAGEPDIDVDHDGVRTFSVRVEAEIQTGKIALDAVMHDYGQLHRMFPLVPSSRVLARPDAHSARVRANLKGCVLFVCRELRHVVDVRRLPNGDGEARSVPSLSDFESGELHWRTEALSEHRTRLHMDGRIRPRFWLPPIIGPALVRHKLAVEIGRTVQRLEQAAQALPAPATDH
ncbi:MAG: SRPBCC family protein [Chromatiales bacterium]|jgi:hypothetical protein|nr:SRPBCC family protein [Chromatiales bacterium]MDX9767722.1 SRPBCC family protein [Ectothiorhodospiraceae bacterium]